jgi:hypothetical protein
MSVFRKAMVYLGLVDDDEYYGDGGEYYDDDGATYDEAPDRRARARSRSSAVVATATTRRKP